MRKWRNLLLSGLLAFTPAIALSNGNTATAEGSEQNDQPNRLLEALRAIDPYRQPGFIFPSESDRLMHCYELERAIAELEPQTYNYKPEFYSDAFQGAAIWGTTIFSHAYLLSIYSGVAEYRENRRIITAADRIEALRRAKAEQHCFES